MKTRSELVFKSFRGVDVSSFPTKVHITRAASGTNFISDNGSLIKRNGFKEIAKFENNVTGIKEFGNKLIIRSGKWFIESNKDFTNQKIIKGVDGNNYELIPIENERTQFFEMKDKLYVIGIGKYLVVYNKDGALQIDEVSNQAYVPTTMIGIDDEKSTSHDGGTINEEINILTNKRKNTLLGREKEQDEEYLEYMLDGGIAYTTNEDEETISQVKVTIETIDSNLVQTVLVNKDGGTKLYKEDEEPSENNVQGEIVKNYLNSDFDFYWEKISEEQYTQSVNKIERYADLEWEEHDNTDADGVLQSDYATYSEYGEVSLKIVNHNLSDLYVGSRQDTFYVYANDSFKNMLLGYGMEVYCRSDGRWYKQTGMVANSSSWTAYDSTSNLVELLLASDGLNPMYYKTFSNQVYRITSGGDGYKVLSRLSTEEEQNILKLSKSYWRLITKETFNESGVYGAIRLSIDCKPVIEGADNITVEFEATQTQSTTKTLDTMKIGTVFGVNGVENQLFLTGATAKEYYSYPYDFTYFPESHTNTVGNERYPITGYGRLSDSSLVVFKSDYNDGKLYFRQVDLIQQEDTLMAYYRVIDKAIEVGVTNVGSNTINNFIGDLLYLTHNGVYGVEIGQNISLEIKHVQERSTCINSLLKDMDLSNAKTIVHNNYLYLSVEDTVFVADSRLKYQSTSHTNYEYEWFMWSNILVREWVIIKNRLGFIDLDNRVCIFDNEYSDRIITSGYEGDALANEDIIEFNQKLDINNNDEITITSKKIFLESIKYDNTVLDSNIIETEDGRSYCVYTTEYDLSKEFYQNEIVYLKPVNEESIFNKEAYYINYHFNYDTNKYEFHFTQNDLKVFGLGKFDIYKPLFNKTLIIRDLTMDDTLDEYYFKLGLKDVVGDLNFVIDNYITGDYDNGVTFNATHKTPVELVWYSLVTDMGHSNKDKTLLSMTVGADSGDGGVVRFGYDTRYISKNLGAMSFKDFSFFNIDFTNFSFTTSMISSYRKQLKEKDFRYIVFKITSNTSTSFNVHSITVEYKINGMSKGVR